MFAYYSKSANFNAWFAVSNLCECLKMLIKLKKKHNKLSIYLKVHLIYLNRMEFLSLIKWSSPFPF